MNIFRRITGVFTAVCMFAVFAIPFVRADVVETKNGSRITGKVTQIDPGAVTISTDFAGDIKIKQGEIISIMTDTPVNIRLSDGDLVQGTVGNATLGSPAGTVVITRINAGEPVTTKLRDISRVWALKSKDPEVVKLEHHWSFEAGLDITGKTGNSEQLGAAYSFRATLASSRDTLQLYTSYNRQRSDGAISADQFKIGADYQNNFYGRTSWYARDEAGFDHMQNIARSNVAGAGVGYDLIKTKKGSLTIRGGLSYRYQDYDNDADPSQRDFGFDSGIVNQWTFKNWSLTNRISYTPSFSDLENYQITHDSYVELPMASPRWKFRIGITNDYISRPSAGLEPLDTTYYARLLLNWKK